MRGAESTARAETTVCDDEVERFNRLAATWWNAHGPMRPLHVINSTRLGYLLNRIAARFGRQVDDLTGLRIADVGCGAGLMCEPLAVRGAAVVGIDAAAQNIAAARRHVESSLLTIDYRIGEPAHALGDGETFDVILLLEVVEHVDDVRAFVQQAVQHLRPGGLLVVSTINRTLLSFATAIVGAEYLFRVLPRGTHQWQKFVRPEELIAVAQACGLALADTRGMRYLPVVHRASWTLDTSVNYVASFHKPLE